MLSPFRRLSACLALLATVAGLPTGAQAQYSSDIDIYSGAPSSSDLPNVLIVLDNTANWNNAFANEIAALRSTFSALQPGRFRVGLMMFTETGNPNNNVDGGYPRAAIRTLDADYQAKLGAMLGGLDKLADKSNRGMAGLTMAEAYYYFAGKAAVSGGGKAKSDYVGNAFGDAASRAVYALPGNALPGFGGGNYDNAFAAGGCAPNYVIYISNGPANDDASSTSAASSRLTAAYAALNLPRPPDIAVSPNGAQSNVADEWARFMKASPQRVISYTIDVDPGTQNAGLAWTALLRSMAVNSGGEYYGVSSGASVGRQISDAMSKIFNQIQAVNSVFASASLPVSVNARGTYLNQVFMGMFRPDSAGKPRWRGNLKQFRFGYDPVTDSISLVDANGEAAISGATGFISPTATSFWSHNSTFWANQQMGTPPSASDAPDGEVVEKGGIAQVIRDSHGTSQADRRIYTCIGCPRNTDLATEAVAQFATTSAGLTSGLLGVGTEAERTALINWVRGEDNAAGELGPGGGITVRPSVHGDVLHSRPAVVNYGGSTGVVVFYGANDGLLRAVNGNQSGAGAGQELWGFVAEEHLSRLKRLRDNAPDIRLSTTLMPPAGTPGSPLPRDYFMDGPLGVYQKVNAAGTSERVVLFAAMRRGGRALYAIDVTTPAQPKFLWKHTAGSLPILGQTWSEPRVARVRGRSTPVIIMGAGYDNLAEDVSPPGTTTMGNAVLVLDALDGTEVKRFPTAGSVAADVSLVDADQDGYVDRAYAVDTRGGLYRLDFETATETAVASWGSYKLASLAGAGIRKFFFAPDVVLTRGYAALLLASGDREKPLATASTDAFFTVYDTRVGKGSATDFTPVLATDLGRVDSDEDKTPGCYIPLSTAGEKAVNAPITAAGITYFSTNMPQPPTPGTCSANLGIAKVYSAPLFCKVPRSDRLTGGGLPPSPVAGVVTVTYTSQQTGQTTSKEVPFIIGAPNPKSSGIEGSKVKPTVVPTRKRRYWYLENAR